MGAKTRNSRKQDGILAMIMPDGRLMIIERDVPKKNMIKVKTFECMSDFLNHPLANRVTTSEVVVVEWEEE